MSGADIGFGATAMTYGFSNSASETSDYPGRKSLFGAGEYPESLCSHQGPGQYAGFVDMLQFVPSYLPGLQ